MKHSPTHLMCLPAILCISLQGLANSESLRDISSQTQERLISKNDREHGLTNANVWSPDSKWLVYDVRENNHAAFNAVQIEAANIESGETRILHTSQNNEGCGVATWSPVDNRVAFIVGPANPTPDWDYSISRRRGVIVHADNPGKPSPIDAMNYDPPFTPGALRGGSHIHIFSPDGRWISFTYDDEILARLDSEANKGNLVSAHQVNQRNIGVTILEHPVKVPKSHPRNNDGNYSVLVTKTVNSPRPGSDEISRAFEEGWIGSNGYLRDDGSRQKRAIAFQGMVSASDGTQHAEVFVVDLPDDLMQIGEGPIEGDEVHRPFPPRGIKQRRLTFTGKRKHPGLCSEPRHWLRSSPDGEHIAFIMKDDNGVPQLWSINPRGGEPRQITRLPRPGIESAFSWSPDGKWIGVIADGSVCLFASKNGQGLRLTPKHKEPENLVKTVCVFSPDGRHVAYLRKHRLNTSYERHVFVVNTPFDATNLQATE